MIIRISCITGFKCSDSVIDIRSRDGRGLYYMKNPKQNEISFNLIAGEWVTRNELEKLKKPLVYVCPPLPQRTVFRKIKLFDFRVGNNPNKCTIDFSKGKEADVFLDYEIAEQDIPQLTFVLYHENGHFFYGGKESGTKAYFDNEHYCDVYAAKNMLERGFNPSQCIYGCELCLSEAEHSKERKDRLFDWLKRVKVKE